MCPLPLLWERAAQRFNDDEWVRGLTCDPHPTEVVELSATPSPTRGRAQELPTRVAAGSTSFFLREVVVRLKIVRREHEALGRHDLRRIGLLRLKDLLEERVLGSFGRGELVPGLEERLVDLRRRRQEIDAVLLNKLRDGVGILPLELRPPAQEGLRCR